MKGEKANKTQVTRAMVKLSINPTWPSGLLKIYPTFENAIREFVYTAWNAESSFVQIDLKNKPSGSSIEIMYNGLGMTNDIMGRSYENFVDSNVEIGSVTPNIKRSIKGRPGIGRFSGFAIGAQIEIVSFMDGEITMLVISKEKFDLAIKEEVALSFKTVPCDKDLRGTKIIIENLNQESCFSEEKIVNFLKREGLAECGFRIVVNEMEIPLARNPYNIATYLKRLVNENVDENLIVSRLNAQFPKLFESEKELVKWLVIMLKDAPICRTGACVKPTGDNIVPSQEQSNASNQEVVFNISILIGILHELFDQGLSVENISKSIYAKCNIEISVAQVVNMLVGELNCEELRKSKALSKKQPEVKKNSNPDR